MFHRHQVSHIWEAGAATDFFGKAQGLAQVKEADRPKLMFVLGLAPRKIGGIEKFLRYFALAMRARGWDTVLCFEGEISDEFRRYVSVPGVTIEQLDHQENLGLACAGELQKLLKLHRPGIFVYAFHGVMRCFPWLARLAGAKRIFFNDHSSRPLSVEGKPISLPKRAIARVLTSPLTGIISVSEFVKHCAGVHRLASVPNLVIRNGVELEMPDPERGRRFRNQYGLPQDALVLTIVSWMSPAKGIDVLFDAMTELLKRRRDVWLLAVGDGPDLERYRGLAEERGIAGRVVFTGILSNPVGTGVFAAGDIFCQPSLHEALSLAALEAMSEGLPVIASKVGGLPEIVKDGQTGLLFPAGDSASLREKIETLLDDAALRRQMGKAGLEYVLAHHRIEDVAERYVQTFLG